MHRFKKLVFVLSVLPALAACTAGGTTAPLINTVNPGDPNYSKLQLAVGTANIFGTLTALNVVSTLRQPNGTSAVGVDTPTITGPFTFGVAAVPAAGGALPDPYTTIFGGGPSLPETTASTPAITGTLQSVHPGTPFCDAVGSAPAGFTVCPPGIAPNTSTFGQSGGVFAMGIAPYNHVADTGQSYSYAPYPQPIYGNGGAHALFTPWGGPPAFDPDANGMGFRDGLIPLGVDSFGSPFFLGLGEGITVFEGVTPHAGQYTLSVLIGFLGSGGTPMTATVTSSAQLSSLALLPVVTAPLVTPDANGDGGATFNASLPVGATEAYVQITDYGPGAGPLHGGSTAANCHGAKGTSFAPVYYTVVVTSAGTYSLGPNHGPNNVAAGPGSLTPTPSICTAAQNNAVVGVNAGDNFTVQMIAFDYPDYEAALSLTQPTVPQAPRITGSSGQSDITISVPVEEDPPYTSQTPVTHSRKPLGRQVFAPPPALRATPEIYRKLGVPPPR